MTRATASKLRRAAGAAPPVPRVEAAQHGVGERQPPSRPGRHTACRRLERTRGSRRAPARGRQRRPARPAKLAAEPAHDEVHRALGDRPGRRVLHPLQAHEARQAVLGLVVVQARPRREARARRPGPGRGPRGRRPRPGAPDPRPREGPRRLVEERQGVARRGASAGSYEVPTIVRPSQGTRNRKRPSLLRAHRAGRRPARGAARRCGRAGGGARPRPGRRPARAASSAQGPGRVDDHAGADLERRPTSASRTATPLTRPGARRRATASAWFATRAPSPVAAWRKPSVSRSVLAACASCQRAAPVRPRRSRPGRSRSASAAETVRASGMQRSGGRPRLRSRVSQSFSRRPSARASRPVGPWP